MRNYKKYRSFVLTLFADFLAGKISKAELTYQLKIIESKIGMNVNKEMWFRFYTDDNIVTDILDFSNGGHFFEHLKTQMQIAIDNPKGFQIYYS